MKDTEKALLFGLAGIAAAVIVFMYVAKPNYEEVQTINQEIVQLESRLAELNQKQANREQYVEDTKKFNEEFEEYLQAFPADMNQEITIMFLDGIKKSNEFSLESLEMGQKEQFYTLGQGGADASLGTGTTETDSTEAEEADASSTEAASTEAAAGDVALTESGDAGVDSAYKCYRAAFPISYYGSYASLKDVINYVGEYSDRMTVNELNVTYDSDADLYSGELQLFCYSVESSERPERKIDLNEVEIGVDNIFDTGVAGSSGSDSDSELNKYDENDGAAIESSYDFYAMLNPSSSDVSAKVAGQNGTGKEASVISNSDNSVSTLTFEIYAKDGKNYCKYTLDDVSYEAEVTSSEDVKILLQSSARKNDDDKAGIRVTINNTTSLPVYVKVSGDDSVSPRVNIAGRSGSVKVYK
ncbi:MAG: hypothetical protein NC300_00505 [Bacteroidales bacterium]|nr:hypothetical protein [Clostridium sp.]MCM1202604.1 hypothetical protein [Bacteroidales bacterium]